MRLRFLCRNHRAWLASDGVAATDSWLRNYDLAQSFLDAREHVKAVNHAGSALEVAELLIFSHGNNAKADLDRFTDSAALLCRALVAVGQTAMVSSVVGGAMLRLQQLLACGVERPTVLGSCRRLQTLPALGYDRHPPARHSSASSGRTLH